MGRSTETTQFSCARLFSWQKNLLGRLCSVRRLFSTNISLVRSVGLLLTFLILIGINVNSSLNQIFISSQKGLFFHFLAYWEACIECARFLDTNCYSQLLGYWLISGCSFSHCPEETHFCSSFFLNFVLFLCVLPVLFTPSALFLTLQSQTPSEQRDNQKLDIAGTGLTFA